MTALILLTLILLAIAVILLQLGPRDQLLRRPRRARKLRLLKR